MAGQIILYSAGGPKVRWTPREMEEARTAARMALARLVDRAMGAESSIKAFRRGEISDSEFRLRVIFKSAPLWARPGERDPAIEEALVKAWRLGGKAWSWAKEFSRSPAKDPDSLAADSLTKVEKILIAGWWKPVPPLPPLFLFSERGLYQVIRWICKGPSSSEESLQHVVKRLGLATSRRSRLDVQVCQKGPDEVLRLIAKGAKIRE